MYGIEKCIVSAILTKFHSGPQVYSVDQRLISSRRLVKMTVFVIHAWSHFQNVESPLLYHLLLLSLSLKSSKIRFQTFEVRLDYRLTAYRVEYMHSLSAKLWV